MKRVIVFATGTKTGGASGLRALAEAVETGILKGEISVAVSHYPSGGTKKVCQDFGIKFELFPELPGSENYSNLLKKFNPDLVVLSGWFKIISSGLNPAITINIHPGPLPDFGGRGLYGRKVHEAVIAAFQKGLLKATEICMHFVTLEVDQGPVFFRYPVLLREADTPEILQERVREIEHAWQPYITNLVLQGQISWDGEDPETLLVPSNWPFL